MDSLNRNNVGSDTNTTAGTGVTNGQHAQEKKPYSHSKDPTYFNRRPTFGQWLKVTWPDILTMVCMGAVGLGIYKAHPAPSRLFPVTFQDGEVVYPQVRRITGP